MTKSRTKRDTYILHIYIYVIIDIQHIAQLA